MTGTYQLKKLSQKYIYIYIDKESFDIERWLAGTSCEINPRKNVGRAWSRGVMAIYRSHGQGVSLSVRIGPVLKHPRYFWFRGLQRDITCQPFRASFPLASSLTFFHWCWRQTPSWRQIWTRAKIDRFLSGAYTICWRLLVKHGSPEFATTVSGINRVLSFPRLFFPFIHSSLELISHFDYRFEFRKRKQFKIKALEIIFHGRWY